MKLEKREKNKEKKKENKDPKDNNVDKEELDVKRKRKKTAKFLNNKKENILALIRAYKIIHLQQNSFYDYLKNSGRSLLEGLDDVEYQAVKEEILKDMEVIESYDEISKKAKEIQSAFEDMLENINQLLKNSTDKST
jgi:hypothetical protein